ncbi:Ewing's tumor-associated antigen 1 [Oryzias melastigma]|uniref:Ewing's tumor-associated antigen 1 n=1 Tax=Oryzias melastigma TaxID=30732 RepID=A0A834CGL3_ORYME|nr:Ewing's tumor-associated antigen 1 [Oryzias melastigma]
MSQDIFWDCTSPPPAGSGHRNGRGVEISDIVSRIAPKKSKGKESPLLQWIDDGALSHTPEIPKTRARKKSARRSSVENLLKLARQFDENMQRDGEALDEDGLHQAANTTDRDLKKDQTEAELQALFDCSTQAVSGRLSEVFSQDAKEHPAGSADSGTVRQTGADDHWDDFEDDWENDDLLNDSLVLKLTEDPKEPLGLPPASTGSRRSCGALEEACLKPKATTRSTFRLAPNPHFQPKEVSGSGFTAVRPKLQPSTVDRTSSLQPGQTRSSKEPDKQISDSSWGDEDDALLCQACDSMEMISNRYQHQDIPPEGLQGTQRHPPVHAAAAKARRPGAFARSNSLPESSGQTISFQGWDLPSGGGANPRPCQSATLSLGQFNQSRSSSTALQAGRAGAPPNSNHATFKRNMSDSALMSSKVVVSSLKTARCSAADIERKKQEALTRRRLRLQSVSKPS